MPPISRIDITPKIIAYLLTDATLVSLVSNRIISPDFLLNAGERETNPKIAIKQAGGTKDYQQYFFRVRSNTQKEARTIANRILYLFLDTAPTLTGVNLEWVDFPGGLSDQMDDTTTSYETIFYLYFYFLEM